MVRLLDPWSELVRAAARRDDVRVSVDWDAVPADLAGGWPSGGELLLLWPRLHGDQRRPAWTERPGDPEDQLGPWWNDGDRALSARLLAPFHLALLGLLAPADGRGDVVAAARIARIAEGAAPAGTPEALHRLGGAPGVLLLARHGERAVWLWLPEGRREPLLASLAAATFACARLSMDWLGRKDGFPGPRVPAAPGGAPR